ncbi:MAG: SPFH domain-containing protein [Phycisphaerae bacterium]
MNTSSSSVRETDRRGEFVALFGMAISLSGALLLGGLGIWSENTSTAVWGAAFQMFGGIGIWILCYIQLHQRRLLAEEELEVTELERLRREKLGGAQTIFEEEDLDRMDALSMGRRLRSIERFLIPMIALAVAVVHLIAGISLFPWALQFPPLKSAADINLVVNAEIILFFTGGIAFVTFMVSRYALGLSRLRQWSALRAGGNFLFGASAVCLAISIALLCEISGLRSAEAWLGKGIGLLLIFLAVETVANFILDFYRPRVPDALHRPFYDSRLLGMFSEPGGILRKFAHAVDYQFGFKVSETWFYKLLGRAVLPLLGVQVLVFLALTCIVVVPPGHQAVIDRWGRPMEGTAKPGVHLMYPWPIDRARVIPVERVQRMVLGHGSSGDETEHHDNEIMEDQPPILWTKKHVEQEYRLLVADRKASADAKVPVNLLSVSMPVQWRVKHARDADVIRYDAQSQDAANIIESMAYRELTRYAAAADITDLLGEGGVEAAAIIHNALQEACDRAGSDGGGLGIEIVYVGIGGVHPPPDEEVAQTYQDVVSAIEKKDAAIKKADGDAAMARISSGGVDWKELHQAILEEDLAQEADAADLADKTARVEHLLLAESGGQARVITAQAVKQAYSRLFSEKSKAERYAIQLAAYDVGQSSYLLRVYLRTIEESLRHVHKYVIAMDDPSKVLYLYDLSAPVAMDLMGAEIRAMDEKNEKR